MDIDVKSVICFAYIQKSDTEGGSGLLECGTLCPPLLPLPKYSIVSLLGFYMGVPSCALALPLHALGCFTPGLVCSYQQIWGKQAIECAWTF